MQSEIVDKKIQILYDNYRDNTYARDAQKEVDQLRTSASKYGLAITTAAFLANEVARMSMRSRKYSMFLIDVALFKLKAINVGFWLFAPQFMCRKAFDKNV